VELDRLQASIRKRTEFEAVDLGFSLLRNFAGPVYTAYLTALLPLTLLIWVPLYETPIFAASLMVWVLPLVERVPLFVLSRQLFGEHTPWSSLIKKIPSLLLRDALSELFWYRASPYRSYLAPVTVLEGQRGAARGARRSVLAQAQGGVASLLTLFAVIFEMMTWMGLATFLHSFLPTRPSTDWANLIDQMVDGQTPAWFSGLLVCTWLLAVIIVRPMVVASGFSLYLNRRTELEGWDIEIQLRRLARRALLLGLVLWPTMSPPVIAQQEAPQAPAEGTPGEPLGDFDQREEPREGQLAEPELPPIETAPFPLVVTRETAEARSAGLEEVLKRPEFGHESIEWVWRPRPWFDFDFGEWETEGSEPIDLPFPNGLAQALVVALVVGLLVLLIVGLRHAFPTGVGRGPAPPEAQVGSVTPLAKGGPGDEDIAEAMRWWRQGRPDRALGVLYRRAVADLKLHGLLVDDSATEGDCLRLARRHLKSSQLGYFAKLTRVWQASAYAHRAVTEPEFLELCEGLRSFRPGTTAEPAHG
jgi:hypothetical protein